MLRALTDEQFRWWLAGFIDGEGCFAINHDRKRDFYHCQFSLKQRDDNGAVLEEIAERTGLGKVYDHTRRGPSRPQRSWRVTLKDDVLALVEFLDQAPSQTIKRRDYVIWREAVHLWIARTPHHGGRYGRSVEGDDWAEIASLRQRLKDVRQYESLTPVA
jgi:hypothetical protein